MGELQGAGRPILGAKQLRRWAGLRWVGHQFPQVRHGLPMAWHDIQLSPEAASRFLKVLQFLIRQAEHKPRIRVSFVRSNGLLKVHERARRVTSPQVKRPERS